MVGLGDPHHESDLFAGELCQGIAFDYLSLACSKLGITVLPVSGLDQNRSLALLGRPGGVDLLLDAARRATELGASDIDTDHVLWAALHRDGLRTLVQRAGADYRIEQGSLVFTRELHQEGKLGFWRWTSIVFGVAGTYRQNDVVDVIYDSAEGGRTVASNLPVRP